MVRRIHTDCPGYGSSPYDLLAVVAAPLQLSILGGLLIVRAFILFHDFLHGALLRKSPFAKGLFYVFGMIVLTPPRHWRRSHNFHHAHVGKPITPEAGKFSLLTSNVGSFGLMTIEMWESSSNWQRWHYRISRHFLTLAFAYITVFLGSLCIAPLWNHPRKNWEGVLAILTHGGIIAALWSYGGFATAFFAFLLPFAIAAASGAYLFAAQHNFEGFASSNTTTGTTTVVRWNLRAT